MKQLFLLFTLFSFGLSFSQEMIQFVDAKNDEPIPFVKMVCADGSAYLSDLDGFISKEGMLSQSAQVRSFGYRDTTIAIQGGSSLELFRLQSTSSQLDEYVVVPGINPAHRIIDEVIAHKKQNNPYTQGTFEYESYSKFFFTGNPDAVDAIPDDADSNKLEMKKFFKEQHLFILESVSERFFMPPARSKEIIKAYKVSGFNNPMFSTFANDIQSFNFYENQFDISGKSFINPIAFGATKRYLFILEDTTYQGKDTVYTISFRPRANKTFEGLKGYLYVNTNGYAIEKVVSEPANTEGGFSVKIVQEYQFINKDRWFPVKLSSEFSMTSISLDATNPNLYIVGKGNTYLKNISFDKKYKKGIFSDDITIETDEDAGNLKSDEWEAARMYELSAQDKKTYEVIDSLSSEHNFDRKLTLLTNLTSLKMPVGKYLYLNLDRIISYNLFEGIRLGAGLQTSEALSKRFFVGGYAAWATKDQKWKYGAFGELKLAPRKDFKLKVNHQYDVFHRGGNPTILKSNVFNSESLLSNFYVDQMDYNQKTQVILESYLFKGLKMGVSGTYRIVDFSKGYRFMDDISEVKVAEVGAEISYSYGEKFRQIGSSRISMGSKFPRLSASIVQGVEGVFGSQYQYSRFKIDIVHQIKLMTFGKLNWSINLSQTNGDVPLFLMQRIHGTGKDWWLSVPNTFETVRPSEFYNRRQASLFVRYHFPPINPFKSSFRPEFAIHHAMGIGDGGNVAHHSGVEFQSADKGIYESGILADNIISIRSLGVGIGAFARYGSTAHDEFSKNIVYKISLNFAL